MILARLAGAGRPGIGSICDQANFELAKNINIFNCLHCSRCFDSWQCTSPKAVAPAAAAAALATASERHAHGSRRDPHLKQRSTMFHFISA